MSAGSGGIQGDFAAASLAFEELKFLQKATELIVLGDILNLPHIFARWNVTNDPTEIIVKRLQFGGSFSCAGIVDSGAGNINFAVVTSTDNGATWVTTALQAATFGGFLEIADQTEIPINQLPSGITDFAIVGYMSNGTSTGRLQEINCRLFFALPVNYTIQKVV